MLQLQHLANQLGIKDFSATKNDPQLGSSSSSNVKFNKKLLDFDYEEDEIDEDEDGMRGTPTEAEPPMNQFPGRSNQDQEEPNPLALSMAQNLLSNPELLSRLQEMQKTMQQTELLKLSLSELTGGSAGLADEEKGSNNFLSSATFQAMLNEQLALQASQ
jgi:hypothetical protein